MQLGAKWQTLADYAIPWGVAIILFLTVGEELGADGGVPLVAGQVLAIAQGLVLRWRRRRSGATMIAALVMAAAYQALVPEIVIPFAPLVALFSVASLRAPRTSLPAFAGTLALASSNFFIAPVEDAVFAVTLAVAAWALGEGARNRRAAIARAAEVAARDEQARIARELHDVLAHSVSVIVVQASAAVDVFDSRPDRAREALESIERTGRDALTDLRRVLGSVRGEAGAPEREPQPALADVDRLAEALRASGLAVEIRREGAPVDLPAGVELSAYRVVQEALTNTLRHSGAQRAEIVIRYAPEELELDVRDDGAGGVAPADNGHGLPGMRQRVAALGGELRAGPEASGGFRVRARLPLEARR